MKTKKLLTLFILLIGLASCKNSEKAVVTPGVMKIVTTSTTTTTTVGDVGRGKHECMSNFKKKDSLLLHYDCISEEVYPKPPYLLGQDGYIQLEITNINRFTYDVKYIQLQRDVINNEEIDNISSNYNFTPVDIDFDRYFLVLPNRIEYTVTAITQRIDTLNDSVGYYTLQKSNALAKWGRLYNKKWVHLEILSNVDKISDLVKAREAEPNKTNVYNKDIDSLEKVNQQFYYTYGIDKNATIEEYDKGLDALDSVSRTADMKFQRFAAERKSLINSDSTDNSRKKNFSECLSNYKRAIIELNRMTELVSSLLHILYLNEPYDSIYARRKEYVNDFFGKVVNKSEVKSLCEKRMFNVDSAFLELSIAYQQTQKQIVKNELGTVFEKVEAFHNTIPRARYTILFSQIQAVYDAINPTNFNITIRSSSFDDRAEEIAFYLTGEPKDRQPYSLGSKPISLTGKIKLGGGVKIDVSAGSFWNMGFANTKILDYSDYSYHYESVLPDSCRVVTEKQSNVFVPSIGVMFNMYRKSPRSVKLGLSVGFSTNTQRINYYLGAALLVGRSERINLHLGLVGGQVSRVTDAFDTDKNLPLPAGGLISEVPMKTPAPFRLGIFVGVSFNLIGKRNTDALNKIVTSK